MYLYIVTAEDTTRTTQTAVSCAVRASFALTRSMYNIIQVRMIRAAHSIRTPQQFVKKTKQPTYNYTYTSIQVVELIKQLYYCCCKYVRYR